jgi:hypothetical protein
VRPVFISPTRKRSVIKAIQESWPDSRPATDAFVTSPFFDPPTDQNIPTRELWKILRQRGDASVTFQVTAESIPGENGVLVHAPKALSLEQPKGRNGVETNFHRIFENEIIEGIPGDLRPIHLKTLWVQNETWVSYLLGSSNFTSPGLGLKPANLEANLLYLVNGVRAPEVRKQIADGYLEGEDLEIVQILRWEQRPDDMESETAVTVLLPPSFGDAVYIQDAQGRPKIRFSVGIDLPSHWKICLSGQTDVFYDHGIWQLKGSPEIIEVDWKLGITPTGFDVSWDNSLGSAWWPVIIEHASVLPPPEQLKNLRLDTLINILTSARPLHQVLSAWLKRHPLDKSDVPNALSELDPHRRVDTSTFLLQRTRRVSAAFVALRTRLARPVTTFEVLQWKLRGPVGVRAVADAIVREAKSEPERCFLLAELCLELSRIRPETSTDGTSIAPNIVKEEITKVLREIGEAIEMQVLEQHPSLKGYVENALREVSL